MITTAIIRKILDPGPDEHGKRKPWSKERQKLARYLRGY